MADNEKKDPKDTPKKTGTQAETLDAFNEILGGYDPEERVLDLELEVSDLKETVEALQTELGKVPDQLAQVESAAAERTRREVDAVKKYAAAPLAKDLFDLADNFQRAADAITPEMRQDPKIAAIADGFDALKSQLQKAFAKHGIHKVEAQDAKFDPNLHEAVTATKAADASKRNTVATVVQEGYTLHDRLLRPARVIVAM
jgi:molecular chaperone GrpE